MVTMVKKWIASDGSEHDSKQAAEQNARRALVLEILASGQSAEEVVTSLAAHGLLNLSEPKERKPRQPRKPKVEGEPAKADKAAKAKGNGAVVN